MRTFKTLIEANPGVDHVARPRPEILQNIDAYWRATNYLFVGQIYLKANLLLEVAFNTGLSSRDCCDIEGRRRVLTAVACSSTRSINTFDLNMIYIVDPGYQKLAIHRHQTAVLIVSVLWGAIERRREAAVQASRGRKHGLQRGPHALSRQP